MRRWLKRLGLGLLVLILLVAGALAAGRYWLASDGGRDLIVEQARAAGVEIAGLDGDPFGRLTAARVAVLDKDGAWLTLDDAVIAWRPLSLLARRLEIEAVTARRLTVLREPVSEPEAASGPSSGAVEPPPVAIDLKRLAVEEIEIAEALAGRPLRLKLDASAAYRSGAANLTLALDRLDAPGAARLVADYRLETNAFDIDLTATDPAGGLATQMFGLADGVEARLDGAGDLNGWRGTFDAKTGAAQLVDLDLDVVRQGEAVKLTTKGDLNPAPFVPEDLRALVGERVGLLLEGAVNTETSAVVIERLSLDAASAALTLALRYAPEAGTISARLESDRLDAAALKQFAPDVSVAEPHLTVAISGTLAAPKATVTIETARIEAGGPALRDVKAVLNAEGDPSTDGQFLWRAEVDVAELTLGDAAVDSVLAGTWRAEANGAFAADADRLPIVAAVTSEGGLAASFDGAATLAGAVGGKATARVDDLILLAPLAGAPLAGPATLATTVKFGEHGLVLSEIEIAALGARIAGTLKLDSAFDQVDGAFDLAAKDLRPIAKVAGAPIQGAMSGRITLSGAVADPAAKGEIAFAPLVAGAERIASARIRFDTKTLASGAAGTVDVEAGTDYGRANAATRFALQGETLQLDALRLDYPGLGVTGKLRLDLATAVATGAIDLTVDDLAAATRAFGVEASGSGGGQVRLSRARDGAQALSAEIAFAETGGFDFKARTIRLTAEGALGGQAALDVDLTVEGLAGPDLALSTAQATLSGPFSGSTVRVTAKGQAAGNDFEAALAGRLAITDGGQRFRLDEGGGKVGDLKLTLAPGLEAANGPDGMALTGLDVSAGPARLKASARLAGDQFTFELTEAAADLTALGDLIDGVPVTGSVSARGRIAGAIERPAGEITLAGQDLRAVETPDAPPVTLAGKVTLQPTSVRLSLEAAGVGESPLVVTAALGLAPTPGGPPAPNGASKLEARVVWSGAIGPLVTLAPLDDHRVVADAAIDLAISGTLGNPIASGGVTLTDGVYEHLEFGTRLDFERMEITAEGAQVTLQPFRARMGGGSAEASAEALLDAARGFPFKFDLRLNNARLAARDDILANASGTVNVAGGEQKIDVKARIRTETVEVQLVDNLPPSIAVLEVTEVGPLPNGRKLPRRTEKKAADGPAVNLDVIVNIPGQFFVRGRGLESEWHGDIAVVGTAAAPVVNGEIKLKRGALDLLGKQLALSRGSVRLEPDASDRLEAVVDVLAEFEGADYTAAIGVKGPATQPEIVITSTPELPRDEVLARLLFDKNAGALTATESLQLAAAVASLASGGGGGFDPIAEIRRAVGIDALRVDSGEDGPSVEAGKYLTDDVYVGVRQGAGGNAGAVVVEVEVFDSVTIESESKQDGSQEVGARLRWDY